MEKRNDNRKRLRLLIKAEPGAIRAYTGDISPTGLFLVSSKIFKPGTKIRLHLETKEGEALGVGIVRWARKVPSTFMRYARGGMGIEFTWVSPELQALLDDLVV